MPERANYRIRGLTAPFQTREAEDGYHIEGYFAVFNSIYEIFPGATESIAPGAFSQTLGNDIRALIDHETRLVLGRNKAGTLTLREDSHGLWGDIRINPNDQDAMNLYERVRRGDVDQCSIGFNIIREDFEVREDGSVHWTILEIDLHEVSVVTFPAYEDTSVSARKYDLEQIQKRKRELWQESMRKRLKGAETQ